MAEELEIIIGADVTKAQDALNSFTNSIKILENQLARLNKIASLPDLNTNQLQRVNALIKSTENQLNSLKTRAEQLKPSFDKMAQGASAANIALINTGRVLQDLPFGIIGVANNINPLLESFQRLRVQAGSTGGAIKALISGLAGGGGLGLAVSAITGALSFAAIGLQAFTRGMGGAEKKADDAKDSIEKLKESLKDLRSVSEIRIQSVGSVEGDISRVSALAEAVRDTNKSYSERKNALDQLQQANKSYFGDITLETSSMETLTARVNEYTDALIQAAVVKGFENEISKVAPELGKLNKAFNDSQTNIDKLKDSLAKLGATKVTQPQVILPGGTTGANVTQQLSDQTAAELKLAQSIQEETKKRDELGDILQKTRGEYADLQDAIHGAVIESLKFKPLTVDTTAAQKALSDTQKKIIELAKFLQDSFNVPVDLKFAIGDSSLEEFDKAKKILKGIEDHVIRVKFTSITEERDKIIEGLHDVKLPILKPEIDKIGFKQEFDNLVKGLTVPLKVLLDEPSLLETEDQLKQIFSGFSDTNIFTEFGRQAGTKFRDALLKSVQDLEKGFTINPAIDTTDIINSLTSSLAGIKDIQLKVIKSEDFNSAIRTLRDLHDAGVAAGKAVEDAMLKAGRSSEDAAKAGETFAKGFHGITQETENIAKAIDSTLTPAFSNLFDAILEGKNPVKAFFESIGKSIEDLASKLIGAEIEKAILGIIGVSSTATTAIQATTIATEAAAAGGAAAAATAAAAAAGAAAAATAATAAATAAVIAAAAAKAASAAINPLSLLGFLGLGFAEGGRPPVGETVMVGERGPELMKFDRPGTIYSHSDTVSMLSTASVKQNESIKEYFAEARVLQQLKTHFTELIRPIQATVNNISSTHEKISSFSYKLHENVKSLKESFVSSVSATVNNNEVNNVSSSISKSIEKLQQSFSVTDNKENNSILSDSITKSFASSNSSEIINKIQRLSEKVDKSSDKFTSEKSLTIERIINNNFFTESISSSFKSLSLERLQKMFNIPAFATGGAVFGPTLAILGEGFGISRSNPEFVGTANQLQNVTGGQFDLNLTLNGSLETTGDKLWTFLNRTSKTHLRTTGKKPL